MMNISNLLKFAALSAVLALGACTTKKEAVAVAPPPPPPVATPAPPPPPGILPGSIQDFKVNVGDTVQFAYNEYNILETDKGTLQKQAAWLNKYPQVAITVEGHADERGTREYNLALGARRANAVKEFLVSLGVSTSRLQTVSYGKERPLCSSSTEDCWAQNRRGVSTITSGAST